MNLSRLVTFILGLILAVFGVFIILQGPLDAFHLIVGLVLVVVGIVILSGKALTI